MIDIAIVRGEGEEKAYAATNEALLYQAIWNDYVEDRLRRGILGEEEAIPLARMGHFKAAVATWFDMVGPDLGTGHFITVARTPLIMNPAHTLPTAAGSG